MCVVAAAVIIGILAAVGVIGDQSPHSAKEVSARHFGSSSEPDIQAAGGIFGLPTNLEESSASDSRSTPEPSGTTVPSVLPLTEMSMIQGTVSDFVTFSFSFANCCQIVTSYGTYWYYTLYHTLLFLWYSNFKITYQTTFGLGR